MKLRFSGVSALLLVGAISLIPTNAPASQCSNITAHVDAASVAITPDPGCLEVTVETPGCGDQAAVKIRSTCEGTLVLPEGLECDGSTTCPAPFETWGSSSDDLYEDGDKSVTYVISFPDKPPAVPDGSVKIQVAWHETHEEGDAMEMDGCSASGAAAGRGWLWVVALLLPAVAPRRRRR
ncbi:MAG: hypothetical protein HOV80_17100 [Polyangiaceae bacterium]|nr:hypothetical protein [Polyangiaceae bacterium]